MGAQIKAKYGPVPHKANTDKHSHFLIIMHVFGRWVATKHLEKPTQAQGQEANSTVPQSWTVSRNHH